MSVSIVRNLVLAVGLLGGVSGTAFGSEQVNINTADAEALAAALSGVGQARAHAIVEHREANGPFASAEELSQVSGIGSATVEANLDRILVD